MIRPRRKRNKYHNVKTNGYDSCFESSVADMLVAELRRGETLQTQIPVRFACGAKLVIDFGIAYGGQVIRYIEAKGLSTPVFKLKMRMLKHEHPDVYARLTVLKSERALKYEADIKRKAKATRDAKKVKA